MEQKIFAGRFYVFVLLLMVTVSLNSHAQAPRNLITQPVNETQLVTVAGQMHPAARPENDQGVVDDSLSLDHVIMMLKRTPDQQQALTALIDQLHNPKSPAYHQWLTPEQFGRAVWAFRFGPDHPHQWMESHGFTVEEVAPGRNLVDLLRQRGTGARGFPHRTSSLLGERRAALRQQQRAAGSGRAGPVDRRFPLPERFQAQAAQARRGRRQTQHEDRGMGKGFRPLVGSRAYLYLQRQRSISLSARRTSTRSTTRIRFLAPRRRSTATA